MKLMGSYMQKLPPGGYFHYAVTQMKHDFKLPDIFYLDLWPFGPCLLLLTSPDAAAIPTTMSNFPMPKVVTESFDGNVGTTFIEATNGPLWKSLMHQLAPGLTAASVKIHYHRIVDHAKALYASLDQYAKKEQIIDMQLTMGRYPFEVLATVFFGERLSDQAYKAAKQMVDLMLIKNSTNVSFNPLARWRWQKEMSSCVGRLEDEIEARVYARYAVLQGNIDEATKAKAATLLDRMLLPRNQDRQPLKNSDKNIILEKWV
jgi:cytochrome P450